MIALDSINRIAEGSCSYRDFQDILTSYRVSRVMMTAHRLGIFESLAHGRSTPQDICLKTGMDPAYGSRFLRVLLSLGFLDMQGHLLDLSVFSRRFLVDRSSDYQGKGLAFENTLVESWFSLAETLCRGKRIFCAEAKSPDEYLTALGLYLGAMDNAARIRARELWDQIRPNASGLFVDAGAGSGAFLAEFLERHPVWRGMFWDLPDVIRLALENQRIQPLLNRLDFRAVNFLDGEEPISGVTADILLCSNLVHCQGGDETREILSRLVPALADDGHLIIHDFFTGSGFRDELYDLHMMLNTYNGRTHAIPDLCDVLKDLGFYHHTVLTLASSSTALVFSRKAVNPGFLV